MHPPQRIKLTLRKPNRFAPRSLLDALRMTAYTTISPSRLFGKSPNCLKGEMYGKLNVMLHALYMWIGMPRASSDASMIDSATVG